MKLKDSYIYSRWLRKELSEAEIAQLKASGDLETLEKIVKEVDSWEMPSMNQDSYHGLKEKINSIQREEAKVILLKRNTWRTYGIAASVLMVIVGTWLIFFQEHTITYQSLAGQTRSVTLPDNTVTTLNGQSSISINEDDFLKNRNVKLKGEAYFEVTKRGNFVVEFTGGEVKVLGTRFNILSGPDLSTIKCFEGKVMVSDKNQQPTILSSGKALRLTESKSDIFEFKEESPGWIKGESIFKDAPLMEVMNALSVQYNLEFSKDNVNLQRNYSGKFIHKDLKTALDMVFVPMGIKYSVEHPDKKTTRVILN